MAGSDESFDSLRPRHNPGGAEQKPAKRVVKTFSCANCGASISVRTPGEALAIVCGTCQSTIDATDENYRILRRYKEKVDNYSPVISLGSRGELFGRKWEVIGYVARCDEASQYRWEEYLLFNPYYGYRWLTEAYGHWNFVRTLKETPERTTSFASVEHAIFQWKRFRLYNRGKAKVVYAIGEFYWNIRVHDSVMMDDYICPPQMLSLEQDDKEINWSLSEYVSGSTIQSAFNVRSGLLSMPRGVFANQPSLVNANFKVLAYCWVAFIVVLTCMQLSFTSSSLKANVLSQNYQYVPVADKGKTITTPVFQLDKNIGNVEIRLNTNVQNSYLYVAGELVNNDTGVTYDFDRSLEYYWGVEDGESWTEGSPAADLMLYSVPKGKYYINLDCEYGPDSSSSMPVPLAITVTRDVYSGMDYFLCLFLISIVPFILWQSRDNFEKQRWADSDFSPYGQ